MNDMRTEGSGEDAVFFLSSKVIDDKKIKFPIHAYHDTNIVWAFCPCRIILCFPISM